MPRERPADPVSEYAALRCCVPGCGEHWSVKADGAPRCSWHQWGARPDPKHYPPQPGAIGRKILRMRAGEPAHDPLDPRKA